MDWTLSILSLTVFALVLGAVALLRRGGRRRQALLMLVLAGVIAVHGLTGRVRIPLPDRSLYARARESLLQLVQKRYKL